MKGLIFSVRKYSVHDGPGIRVTIFLKGCPLNCIWCHNPEGISPFPQQFSQIRKVARKEFSRIEESGKYYSVEDVMEILVKDEVFMKHSKGGVTFSGGEPMLQHEFLFEALKACKAKGYHTSVDTSGYSMSGNFEKIIPYTDLFLFDIKHLDDRKHKELTGSSNRDIINNYKILIEKSNELIVRFPVIPGFNDDADHLDHLRNFISENRRRSLRKMCLLPFHKTGASKYKKYNILYKMENVDPPSPERMKELKRFFSKTGIDVKIGG